MLVRRVRLHETTELGDAALDVPRRRLDEADEVLGVGDERGRRIGRLERRQQRQRVRTALALREQARGLDGRRGREGVLRPAPEEIAKLRERELGLLQLQIAPRRAVEGVRRQRRGRVGAEDLVVDGVRVGVTLEPEERLRLPEARLARLARRRRERLGASERLERRLRLPQGQSRLAEEQQRGAGARIGRVARHEAVERGTRDDVELVAVRALAQEPEAVGLLEGQYR